MKKIYNYIFTLILAMNCVLCSSQRTPLIEYDFLSKDSYVYQPLRVFGGIGFRSGIGRNGDTLTPSNYSLMLINFGASFDLFKFNKILSVNPGFIGKGGLKLDAYQLGYIPNITVGINSKKCTKFPIGIRLMYGYDFHFNLDTSYNKKANGKLFGCTLVIYGIELNYFQTLVHNKRVASIGISATGGLPLFWKKDTTIKYYYD